MTVARTLGGQAVKAGLAIFLLAAGVHSRDADAAVSHHPEVHAHHPAHAVHSRSNKIHPDLALTAGGWGMTAPLEMSATEMVGVI